MKDIIDILSTALVSDILDEAGHPNQLLPIEIKPNFADAKIFGKAKIMSLKEIGNENYQRVYDGLYFLESLTKGDVLIVANGFKDQAFFGELMSTLAKVKGVEGTIVDGCTRDTFMTNSLKYPVFAKNTTARDIKKRGIVDRVDLDQVIIGGVLIRKGDYILGDIDGVIVIPSEINDFVIAQALKIYENEFKIKQSMIEGHSIKEILEKFGEF